MTMHHGPVQFKAVLSDFLVSVKKRRGTTLNNPSKQVTANPNPFNASTRISFKIEQASKLSFYNMYPEWTGNSALDNRFT